MEMISYKMTWPIVNAGHADLAYSALRSILYPKVFTIPCVERHIVNKSDVCKQLRTFSYKQLTLV